MQPEPVSLKLLFQPAGHSTPPIESGLWSSAHRRTHTHVHTNIYTIYIHSITYMHIHFFKSIRELAPIFVAELQMPLSEILDLGLLHLLSFCKPVMGQVWSHRDKYKYKKDKYRRRQKKHKKTNQDDHLEKPSLVLPACNGTTLALQRHQTLLHFLLYFRTISSLKMNTITVNKYTPSL